MATSAQSRGSCDPKYEKISDGGDEIVEAGYSRNPSMINLVSENSSETSSRGNVSQLLWLYFFIASMIFAFACQSAVTNICGSYIDKSVQSFPDGETFHLIETFRFVLMIPFTFIFASHSSMLMKRQVLFRFSSDITRPDDEPTAKSPPLTKLSFSTILMSYVAINVYLMLIQLGLLFLQLRIDRGGSTASSLFARRIFSGIFSYATLFLYTYKIFDKRTNLAIVICLAEAAILYVAPFLFIVFFVLAPLEYKLLSPCGITPLRPVTPSIPVSATSSDATRSTEVTTALIPQSEDPSLPPLVGDCIAHQSESPSNKVMITMEIVLFMLAFQALLCFSVMISFFLLDSHTMEIYLTCELLHFSLGLFVIYAHILMIFSRKSILKSENTVFRFKNESVCDGQYETTSTVTDPTNRSTGYVWLSCLSFLLYSRTLQIALTALLLGASKLTGLTPEGISTPMPILFIAGILSYTHRVFDIRSTVMAVCVSLDSVGYSLLSERTHYSSMVMVFSLIFLVESYNYHCCAPPELYSYLPQRVQQAADAVSDAVGSYAPPIPLPSIPPPPPPSQTDRQRD